VVLSATTTTRHVFLFLLLTCHFLPPISLLTCAPLTAYLFIPTYSQISPADSAWGPRLYTFFMYLSDVEVG
jgi:hypothetical protein